MSKQKPTHEYGPLYTSAMYCSLMKIKFKHMRQIAVWASWQLYDGQTHLDILPVASINR